jgi:hypothetical protein
LADGRFRATSAAAGPWDPAHLHGGPPAALLGRAVEAAASWPGLVCRLVFDILRPVPVADLEVATRVVRPGRRIELLEAELLTRGEPVMTARAWRIRTASPPAPVEPPPGTFSEPAPPVPSGGPTSSAGEEFGELGWFDGYLSAMEWVFLSGGFAEPGPVRVWARPRMPLVEGEDNTPLTRVPLAADSGNGLSMDNPSTSGI